MKIKIIFLFFFLNAFSFLSNKLFAQNERQDMDLITLSQTFLKAMQAKESGDLYVELYANTSDDLLIRQLDSDAKKYTFWINTYNAFIQYHLQEKPEYYENRNSFFKLPLLNIAGSDMSFADIEHGILRRSQLSLFLGYISNPFASKREKKLRVDKRDYRIHFSLNCGAKSCPPVGIYGYEKINEQLDFMSKKFLEQFSSFDKEENLVTTTSLFSWFRGDFDGPDGIREVLKKYEVISDTKVKVQTQEYDWTLALDNFVILPM